MLILRGRAWLESSDMVATATTSVLFVFVVCIRLALSVHPRFVSNSRSDCLVRDPKENCFLCRFYVVLQFLIQCASSYAWQFYLSFENPPLPKFHFVMSRFGAVSDQIRFYLRGELDTSETSLL